MFTDLFLALTDPDNPRGHPLLAALLYAFCPAAARWWLAGTDPVPPFDPLWQALSDLAGGETLRDRLIEYGFETLLAEARRYIDQVEAYRRLHPALRTPELLPTFPGGRLELSSRFGFSAALDRLGGSWENFFAYIHAWAFLAPDWKIALHFDTAAALSLESLALLLPGIRRPIHLLAPAWQDQREHAAREAIGLLTWHGEVDWLRFALIQLANRVGEKVWPVRPEVWALDRSNAQAVLWATQPDSGVVVQLVQRLAELARSGPYPPLPVFHQPESRCRACGFRALCFTAFGEITPLVLKF